MSPIFQLRVMELSGLDLYCTPSGIVVPHKRRVFVYDSEKCKVAEPLLVAIDTHEIEFS
jgi:hypothetical protein